MTEQNRFTIPARDGYSLAATLYESARPSGSLVIINSATGVKQQYYRRFAQYLNEQGLDVLTYDYRGIGGSAPRKLRGFPARMRDWGQIDFPGVIDWAVEQRQGQKFFVVGHSVGGQILGLAPNNQHVAGLIGVCAQKTWWGLWPKRDHAKLIFLWCVLMPSVSRALGYFPSPWFGLGENLPKGVALEWATWARAKGYTPQVIGEHVRPGYSNYSGSILGFSFDDDTFAPEQAVAGLLDQFASARKTHRHIQSHQLAKPIGHFGFFRDDFKDSLWKEAADWLAGEGQR